MMLKLNSVKGLTENDVDILDDVKMNGNNSAILPDKLVTILYNIINENDVDPLDVEEDGLNIVIDRDTALSIYDSKAKNELDNGETVDQNTVENLLTIDKSIEFGGGQSYPLFMNGYANVEPATIADVYDEITDIIDYINGNL